MPRIPFPTDLPDPIRNALAPDALNHHRMLAGLPPPIFDAYNHFARTVFAGTTLALDLYMLAVLRACRLEDADYVAYHYKAMARRSGLSNAQIKAINLGGDHSGTLNEAQQAVLDFTTDLCLKGNASDKTLRAIRKSLSDQQVFELIIIISLYTMHNRFIKTTGLEKDASTMDWPNKVKELWNSFPDTD